MPLADSLPRNLEFLFQHAGRRSSLKPFAHLRLNFFRVVPRGANSLDVVFEASDLPKAFPSTRLVAADSQIAGNGFVASAVLEDLQREFFVTTISRKRQKDVRRLLRAGSYPPFMIEGEALNYLHHDFVSSVYASLP